MPDLLTRLESALGTAYAFERELGGGGMSRIFLAEERALGRKVVVKVLATGVAATLSADRFAREVRVAAALQHPNIVPVLSAGQADELPYYTMPYVRGESLRARLTSGGALTVRFAIAVLRDIARALAYAHTAGVVHRDVKPENIMLAGDIAVVLDFGIAKALAASRAQDADSDGPEALTRLGVTVGTPAYMAPEQGAGDPSVDHRADLYAWGLVAFELLTGRHAFADRRTAHELLVAHLTVAPPDVGRLRPDVPPGLATLVMRCLAKSPADRPRDAQVLLATLDDLPLQLSMTPTPAPAPAPPSPRDATTGIAVLPFESLSTDPENAYFAEGLTVELITDLSKVRALRVTSRGSATRFKDSGRPLPEAAGTLGVQWALLGNVRRSGSAVRITAELMDLASDRLVWSDKFSGNVEDVFALQERLSREIVDALRVTLTREERVSLAARANADPRVLEYCARARREIFLLTQDGLARARRIIEEGIQQCGEHAQLLAMLGMTHWQLVFTASSTDEQHVVEAERLARLALARDATCSEAYFLLGFIRFSRGPWPESLLYLRRACEVDPANVEAAGILALALLARGQDEEAAIYVRRGLESDPLAPVPHAVAGFAYGFAPRFDLAAGEWAAARRLAGPTAGYALYEGFAHLARGDRTRALESLADSAQMPDAIAAFACAMTLAVQGDREGTVAALEPIQTWGKTDWTLSWMMAQVHAQVGDVAAAVHWLHVAVDRGLAHYPLLAERDPLLAPLRGDAGFAALLDRARAEWLRGLPPA